MVVLILLSGLLCCLVLLVLGCVGSFRCLLGRLGVGLGLVWLGVGCFFGLCWCSFFVLGLVLVGFRLVVLGSLLLR